MAPENANENKYEPIPEQQTLVGRILGFCIYNKLIVGLITLFVIGWGIYVAPFDWEFDEFPRSPISVDAIPDIGENQQIVFTEWPGRSPGDVEDQITYPLTTALLGIPNIKTIRKSIVLKLPRRTFAEIVSTHPQLLAHISQLSSEREQTTQAILKGQLRFSEEEGLVLM